MRRMIMNRVSLSCTSLLVALLLAAATVSAAVPRNGVNMSQVERRFGPPVEKLAAVGNPPITRWIYNGFTVYFEHRLVIHSVVR